MKPDSYYFPHDFNARNDRKLIKVKHKYRQSGVGIFWSIVEMLYEENGKLALADVPTLAADFREKETTVLSVINDFELFENDGIFFWSESVNKRIVKRLEKSEKAKESASHRWQNANAMRTHSDGNARKERKGKEIKGKEIERVNGAHAPSPTFKTWDEEGFKKELANHIDEFGRDTLNEFFKYWSEKSASGRMKFQLEKTWETKKRLDNWQRIGETSFKKN